VTIEDDGVGFDVDATFDDAARGESVGLLGMRERAQLAGGQMEIVATEGHGTLIRARFPVPGRAASHQPEDSQG
jgi:signal transduction histidine kinase